MRWSATEAVVKALEAYRREHDSCCSEQFAGVNGCCTCDLCIEAEMALAEMRKS